VSAHAARADLRLAGRGAGGLVATLSRVGVGTWLGAAVGAGLAAISFEAGGGTILGPTTTVEMALTLAGGAVIAIAILRAPRPHAAATLGVGLLIALAVLTTGSIIWSESPSDSWLEASRAFAYASLFAAAVSGARLVPQRWASVLGGLLVAGAAVCGYALLTKVFPGALDANDTYARLRAPFGYWNAIGLIAALTVIACLWLGSRREGNPVISALAYPLAGMALIVLMLAYSRGSLLALAIGCAVWFAAAPRRLRSAAVLITSIAGAAPAVAWAFRQPVLTQDRIDASMRAGAGHDLGLLVLMLALVLMAAGLAVGFLAARNPMSVLRRDQLGLALVVSVALIPVGVAGGLALSSRGLPGSISHAWTKLTDPHAKTPPNTPGRLTGVASVRAQYWNEALRVSADHPAFGVGAGAYVVARQRYRSGNLTVRHAHGYVVQTLADLGAAGLLLSVALLAAWGYAALAATRPFGWRPRLPWRARTPALNSSPAVGRERTGLLCLLACAVAFGTHSIIDWTWSIPGVACLGLLCAGWVAGRAPALTGAAPAPLQRRLRAIASGRSLGAGAVVILVLIVAWSQWQPLRSANAADQALIALQAHNLAGARADVNRAASIDPVSVDPLFDLAAIETSVGNLAGARGALERAVRVQPANAETWLRLADLRLTQQRDAAGALTDLGPALYLDPHNADVIQEFLTATRQSTGGHPSAAGSAATPAVVTPTSPTG
jgi:tetratricopeptide (TPR) repeat protein